MTIAAISAISFVLGATVAYVASRYPGHREVIDAVGAVFLIGWALLSSLLFGRGTGNRPGTSGVMRGTAAPSGRC